MERLLNAQSVLNVGETIRINGWVYARRDMGKVGFLDMRDRSGLLQVVLVPSELDETSAALIDTIRPEFVLEIEGVVQARGEKQVNKDLVTGTVEILAKKVTIQNTSETPPFELDRDSSVVNEEIRLKYRYLDLRTERMQKNIRLRDKVIKFFRDYMHKNDFVEIETPILMKGTPEGAREFMVPSRLHEGKFYVLPQSPQQFKQLSMVAGFERYFQIARCFRDEDQRGDRQPEFTQLDYEMSFVTQEDIMAFTEVMFIEMVETLFPEKKFTSNPFTRLTHAEVMEQYGTDKPDLRENKEDPNELAFLWVTDFPMFERLEDGSVQAMHHPFCSVKPEDMDKLDSDPMSVRANAYDLVLNGYELSSGSIRVHERALQKKIFDLLEVSEEEQKTRFGHMLEAFTYGAPPHGGFAPGIDRIVMLMAGEPNIREVIAFPKTGDARDLMMGAPSDVPLKALKDVHIKIDASK
ncbi:MAG: aspartate--tRNA ligase [bacterium]|nr:aspartate--tRNA ligase [bacterium]